VGLEWEHSLEQASLTALTALSEKAVAEVAAVLALGSGYVFSKSLIMKKEHITEEYNRNRGRAYPILNSVRSAKREVSLISSCGFTRGSRRKDMKLGKSIDLRNPFS